MPEILSIGEIKRRGEAINYRLKTIARDAGVDPTAAGRAASGRSDMLSRNLAAMTRALLAKEREVKRHLDKVVQSAVEEGGPA